MKTINKAIFTLILFSAVFSLQAEKLPIYNESFQYKAYWKGVSVGTVDMKTSTNDKNQLRSFAKVNSWKTLRNIYYVQGTFGTIWNYESRSPVYAYESVYQGDTWQNRKFKFSGSKFTIYKHEKKFSENSYPHKGPLKKDKRKTQTKPTKGHQDLLGAFYYVRSLKNNPQVGQTLNVPVLPAGAHQVLVLKVLGKKTIKSDALGTVQVLHVRSRLAQQKSGGNLFFDQQSPIELYITDDSRMVPVEMWTQLPVIGRVDIKLEKYTN